MLPSLPLKKTSFALAMALLAGMGARAQVLVSDPLKSAVNGGLWTALPQGGYTASTSGTTATLAPFESGSYWRINNVGAVTGGLAQDFNIVLTTGTYTVDFYVGYTDANSRAFVGVENVNVGFYDAAASVTDAASLSAAVTAFRESTGVTFDVISAAAPALGGWAHWSYTFTIDGTSPLLGSEVNFGMVMSTPSTGGFGAFDSVKISLVSDAVPEPGTWVLLGMAGGLLAVRTRYRRRRQAKA